MSASIWDLMQKQLRRSGKAQRLKPLMHKQGRAIRDTIYDLGPFSNIENIKNDFMLDNEKEEGEIWHEDNDELCDRVNVKDWYESDDDLLFQGFWEQSWLNDDDLLQAEEACDGEDEALCDSPLETYVEQERQDGDCDLLFRENEQTSICADDNLHFGSSRLQSLYAKQCLS
jgi:hypothetical protein